MRSLAVCAITLFLAGTPILAQVDLDELAERVAALEADAAAARDGTYLTELLQSFTLYGFVRVDANWTDSEMSDNQIPFYAMPEGRTRSGGTAGASGAVRKDDSDFTLYGRLTRLGLRYNATGEIAGARVSGKIEVDFYGFAASDSRNDLRIRHAYVDMQWEHLSLLAGQTRDLVSPLYPSVNADIMNWGVGNTGDRRPQIRLTGHARVGESAVISAAFAISEPNAVATTNTDAPDGILDGEDSGWPLLQARAAVQLPLAGSSVEIGVWGALGQEEDDSRSATSGEKQFDVELVGIDAMIPLGERAYVKGEAWVGRNVDDLRVAPRRA